MPYKNPSLGTSQIITNGKIVYHASVDGWYVYIVIDKINIWNILFKPFQC